MKYRPRTRPYVGQYGTDICPHCFAVRVGVALVLTRRRSVIHAYDANDVVSGMSGRVAHALASTTRICR